jgi:hypothetical protein
MGRRHCEKLQEALESKSLFDLCACPSRGEGSAVGCRYLPPPHLWGRVGEGVFGRMPKSPPGSTNSSRSPHRPPTPIGWQCGDHRPPLTLLLSWPGLTGPPQYTRRCRRLLGPPVSLCSPGDDIGDSVARMRPRPRIGGQCGDHRGLRRGFAQCHFSCSSPGDWPEHHEFRVGLKAKLHALSIGREHRWNKRAILNVVQAWSASRGLA